MIRPIHEGEALALAPLFAPFMPWLPQGALYAMMQYERRRFFVAEQGGEAVAIAAYGPSGYSRHAWALGPAATLPTHRGKGVGSELIQTRLDAIQAAVIASGLPAALVHVSSRRPHSWVRLGFRVIDEVDGSSLLCRRLTVGAEGER
ncbi:GNAT family N-acetyltransferase [Azospirillum sp. A26]|uniref:GNAT family N-acetyltransferase n=1 Tax=Azospirillum sp. A26 TaxID=3160607 RepID=UPI00366E9EFE